MVDEPKSNSKREDKNQLNHDDQKMIERVLYEKTKYQ